ncbi:MAG: hypothetical protein AB7I25_03295 [Vicinamibacterales bacterium]
MIEAGIGRLLVASLHHAITEHLPTRVDFYEEWLSPRGLRDGRMGLAPLQAVLSFLRQEGEAYETVMRRAGELAADWWLAELPGIRRSSAGTGPLWLRGRLVAGLCADFVRQTFRDSAVTSSWSGGQGQVALGHSVFCDVRGHDSGRALCGFYVAAFGVVLPALGLPATVEASSCHAMGATACVLRIGAEAR